MRWIVGLLVVNLLATVALFLWLDERITFLDHAMKVLAMGIAKSKEEVLEELDTATSSVVRRLRE